MIIKHTQRSVIMKFLLIGFALLLLGGCHHNTQPQSQDSSAETFSPSQVTVKTEVMDANDLLADFAHRY